MINGHFSPETSQARAQNGMRTGHTPGGVPDVAPARALVRIGALDFNLRSLNSRRQLIATQPSHAGANRNHQYHGRDGRHADRVCPTSPAEYLMTPAPLEID